MSRHELDEAVAKVRNEKIDDETVKAAAKRVFGSLFDSSFIASAPAGKIRGCADVRALIPAYLDHTLPAARVLLVEDHVLQCIECRHALQEARHGASRVIPINRPQRKGVPMFVWAAAAVLAIGIGLGLTGLLPGQNAVRATVASVQGTLYKVTDLGMTLVQVGEIIKNTDELRTAKGSRAILRLAGGAEVEIAERSDIALSNGWRGTNINLARGQMIVNSQNELKKAVYITNGDMTIPVTGGVVAFDHGTKESRVAVAKGSVEISTGSTIHTVTAGQLYGGELHLANLPVASEFAWSQNAGSYHALLQQFSALQKDIQSIPAPGLRYSSQLPQYLPADTFLYAAIPNLGGTISEAKKLFVSRLAESDVLRRWWQQKDISKNGKFDQMIDQISAFSSYLGDEIVVAIGGDVNGQNAGPVFLASIAQPGLAAYLQSSLPANADVQIVTPGAPAAAGKFLIEIDNNLLIATNSAIQLKRMEVSIQNSATASFTTTPFFARINRVYQNGASYFLAANLEQITAQSVHTAKGNVPAGLENVRYLVLERKTANGGAEMRASVSFDGARHGIASWLGAPSPAGSLDFVSPDAIFAASMVMKNPRVMMQELLAFAGTALDDFQAHAGVSLLDDVAAPLGTDVTMAMDAGLAPILAIEVNDPAKLQQTLSAVITQFNQQAPAKTGHLTQGTDTANNRTFYSISNDKAPGLAAYYTFTDGYLVASSSEANLLQAIQNRQTGNVLATSNNFRSKLPADGYPNFSAMIYSNVNSSIGDLTKQLKNQRTVSGLFTKGGSGLVCVYGETDRVLATARGSFLGFDLGTLVGLQEGKPLSTMIASAPLREKGAARGTSN